MADKSSDLTKNKLWTSAFSIAEDVYNKIDNEFGDLQDEKFNTNRRLRTAANDVLFYISQAISSSMPETAEFDWNFAKKNLFSIKTLHIFGVKRGFLKADPYLIKRIDQLTNSVDKNIESSTAERQKREAKDLEPWLEKYRLWKLMEGK
ncbi:MAG TPA: hypothetical protein VIH90_04140 [Candidatus Saccharimonadales bacterium]